MISDADVLQLEVKFPRGTNINFKCQLKSIIKDFTFLLIAVWKNNVSNPSEQTNLDN